MRFDLNLRSVLYTETDRNIERGHYRDTKRDTKRHRDRGTYKRKDTDRDNTERDI